MSTIFLFIAGFALYFTMDHYADKKTRRIPPMNTPRGKQARIVTGVAWLICAAALIINVSGAGSASEVHFAILEVAMGVIISIAFALARMGKLKR